MRRDGRQVELVIVASVAGWFCVLVVGLIFAWLGLALLFHAYVDHRLESK